MTITLIHTSYCPPTYLTSRTIFGDGELAPEPKLVRVLGLKQDTECLLRTRQGTFVSTCGSTSNISYPLIKDPSDFCRYILSPRNYRHTKSKETPVGNWYLLLLHEGLYLPGILSALLIGCRSLPLKLIALLELPHNP